MVSGILRKTDSGGWLSITYRSFTMGNKLQKLKDRIGIGADNDQQQKSSEENNKSAANQVSHSTEVGIPLTGLLLLVFTCVNGFCLSR